MNERQGDNVKRAKKNKPCGYNLRDGGQCQRYQQYGRVNINRYCHKHFNEWFAANTAASATDVPAESTSVVETNTTTTVDESNIGIHHDDNEGAASTGDVTVVSTLVVERNTTTTVDESNINLRHDEIEGVHPEPSNDNDAYNKGNEDVSSARDDGHDGNNLFLASISAGARSTTTYDESIHTRRDDNAGIPATIEASDTVASTIVTNSPQSRAINSALATAFNQELISCIERSLQDAIRPYEDTITKLKRSFENLQNKYNRVQLLRIPLNQERSIRH